MPKFGVRDRRAPDNNFCNTAYCRKHLHRHHWPAGTETKMEEIA